MAEFLTTQGTSYHIENIITNAKNKLVLISPYLQLSKTLFERLRDADKRKVKITLVYGKDKLKAGERNQLGQLDNLSLYFLENLHAKCFFNEEYMVITSMNMYEFSEKNNREMGVLISAKNDENAFREAVREAKSIVDASPKHDLRVVNGVITSSQKGKKGCCIRCGTKISYDIDAPYCRDCFTEWVIWKNQDYEESYCHTCGSPALTTMLKTQCYSCYRKSLI